LLESGEKKNSNEYDKGGGVEIKKRGEGASS